MNDQLIPNVTSVKDLGITIDPKLDFGSHIKQITSKAYCAIALIFKCFITNDLNALLTAYGSIVRSQVEYACSVWNPTLGRRSPLGCLTAIDNLESVQRVFTRRLFCRCNLPNLRYTDRMKLLNLDPLELRRIKHDLQLVYKLVHGLLDVNIQDFFLPGFEKTRGHVYKLQTSLVNRDVRMNYFTVRVVPIWNSLPLEIVASPSIKSFKANLNLCHDMLLSFCKFDRNL